MLRLHEETILRETSSDNTSTMQCGYCNEIIDDDSYLHCEQCREYVHIKCLRHASTPGDILGDVFFDFTCAKCMQLQCDGPSTSSGGFKEKFVRQHMPWLLVITLALYNLSIKSKGLSHHGYFHWRTHIVGFIDRNWDFLFEPNVKKRKKWIGSVTGNMSHNSPEFFLSGQEVFNESGWWKLTHSNLTPRQIFKIYEEITQKRQQKRIDKRPLDDIATSSDVSLNNDVKRVRSRNESEEDNLGEYSCSRTLPYMGRKPKLVKQLNIVDIDSNKSVKTTPEQEPLSSVQSSLMDFLAESLASDDLTLFNSLPNIAAEPLVQSVGKSDFLLQSLTEAQNEHDNLFDIPDIKPDVNEMLNMPTEVTAKLQTLYKQNDYDLSEESIISIAGDSEKNKPKTTGKQVFEDQEMPTTTASFDSNLTQNEREDSDVYDDDDDDEDEKYKPRIVKVTKFVDKLVENDAEQTKLEVEVKQEPVSGSEHTDEEKDDITETAESKQQILPPCKPSLFTKSVKRKWPWLEQNDHDIPEELKHPPGAAEDNKDMVIMSEYEERQLLQKMHKIFALEQECNLQIHPYVRRFYRKLCVRNWQRENSRPVFNLDDIVNGVAKQKAAKKPQIIDRYQLLSVTTENARRTFYARIVGSCEYELFESPYTGRILHPFIYRNKECVPPWLKLMCELQYMVNGIAPTRAPIDYCYVRPNHIAAVNGLLQTVFWPGIDMSECLSYPDFSVVAMYKKLVIGCGFLVPDVSCNEAYISFMAVRPGWQRSGIATFMLYHLIQTCMTKDITLHVSASNPAVVLYQKFGFKIEEIMLDFYEKYLPIDTKQSRHAFFLRLMR